MILQATDERHEAELHQMNEEIRQKNTRLEQVQVYKIRKLTIGLQLTFFKV